MKESFRQCMAWLHTWVGLVVGWILFFVFVTGTAGYVDDEITRWMEPERPLPAQVLPEQSSHMLDQALTQLQAHAPEAKAWTITLPHQALNPRATQGLSIAWEELPQPGQRGRRGGENLDPTTGQILPEVEPRTTAGGTGLYRMHYALHYMPYPVAIWLVGICTMLMLLAVITGVVTHKKIFTDFFTFRPGKGQRSWLDAHNIVSVMSLPFFLMITYTGLIFFMSIYMPAGRDVMYGATEAGRQAYFQDIRFQNRAFLPVFLPQASLSEMMQSAEQQWGKNSIASIQITHPQDSQAYVELRRTGVTGVYWTRAETLRFNAIDGSAMEPEDTSNLTGDTHRVLLALHEGVFAEWWMRWLYFISGLLGCAVIGTGLVLWTVKRRTQHQKRMAKASTLSVAERFDAAGLRLIEILNAGTLAGLPLGLAAYFWANRLLPVTMADRAAWEFHALFLVWGWSFLFASWRPLKRAWLELLWLTTAAYALIPVLNMLTTDRHLGITLPYGDWGLAGFDLTMLGLAATFAYIAIKMKRKWHIASLQQKATAPARLQTAGVNS
ncbi:PepSY-associated TM helix domain-containing protein [Alcaligenes parafaecalis]|uniref:PepSY-associated TM helix domain-containing protein n=1 Tax=Alcaligenes parafaecalis TaxID=171260 RepID=A0ABT3VHG3_9BURK|nr:PepSY-associated TM helix domain-containing protein [Alcaligenes parafaecalis]MCX5462703.1 PepSY-associated TM helix domain-containing protein [Alcaligenes parafaecalis]